MSKSPGEIANEIGAWMADWQAAFRRRGIAGGRKVRKASERKGFRWSYFRDEDDPRIRWIRCEHPLGGGYRMVYPPDVEILAGE